MEKDSILKEARENLIKVRISIKSLESELTQIETERDQIMKLMGNVFPSKLSKPRHRLRRIVECIYEILDHHIDGLTLADLLIQINNHIDVSCRIHTLYQEINAMKKEGYVELIRQKKNIAMWKLTPEGMAQ